MSIDEIKVGDRYRDLDRRRPRVLEVVERIGPRYVRVRTIGQSRSCLIEAERLLTRRRFERLPNGEGS
jgi:hypothetical protein